MRTLLASLGIVPLGLCILACGHETRGASTEKPRSAPLADAIPPLRYLSGDYDRDDYEASGYDADNDDRGGRRDRDNDADSEGRGYFDGDDAVVLRFGKPARARDRRAVSGLVKRYYAVAARQDGARGCALIATALARSVPESLGRTPGPSYLHGGTCAAVMTKVFEQNRRQLVLFAHALHIAAVRVRGERGIAVLSFKTLPGRRLDVVREGGVWKISALLDGELP